MGNCLTSNRIQVQEETIEPQMLPAVSRLQVKKNVDGDKIKIKIKKMVRFKLQEHGSVDEGESKNGAVRIRVVVTKEELKQILNCQQDFKDSSLEKFINVMELRGNILGERRSDGGLNGNWRPSLESIPEDL